MLVMGGIFLPGNGWAQFFFLENPLVGEAAADFTLKTLDGKTVNMTQFRDDKSAIIFFWATWCPYCRAALKELNNEKDQIEEKGIKIILVDLGETESEVGRYIKANKIDLTVFLDEESFLNDPYAIIGVPTFVLVNSQGIVKAVEHALPPNYEEILVAKKDPVAMDDFPFQNKN